MARLLFLQDLEFEYLGPMYISSMLKEHNHEVLLRVGSNIEDFRDSISSFKPDMVAFSVMSGSHHWALEIAEQVKKTYGIPNVFGGSHPTFYPDFIKREQVDCMVRGEGEEACLEIMDRIDKGEDYLDVANVSVSRNGQIYENDVRDYPDTLDIYPLPDRGLYTDLSTKIDTGVRSVITSRGCPWKCTFCFNDAMQDLYKGKGKYVRFRSVDNVLSECKQLSNTPNVKTISFTDDVFGIDRKWLYEFLPKYKEQIGLPFICLVRADLMCRDEEYVKCLADNGCSLVSFGIESGNEEIRNQVLKKRVTDEHIHKAAALLHKYGIKFRTFNILGLPGETLDDALSTVKINIDIKTDFPWCSTFMPFPGTTLTDFAIDHDYVNCDFTVDELTPSFFSKSNLVNHKDIKKLANLQRLFQTAVLMPWTFIIIKQLIKLPPNVLFTMWFGFIYFLVHIKAEGRTFFKTILFTIRNSRRLLDRRNSNNYKDLRESKHGRRRSTRPDFVT